MEISAAPTAFRASLILSRQIDAVDREACKHKWRKQLLSQRKSATAVHTVVKGRGHQAKKPGGRERLAGAP
jgi:hypothetical protein